MDDRWSNWVHGEAPEAQFGRKLHTSVCSSISSSSFALPLPLPLSWREPVTNARRDLKIQSISPDKGHWSEPVFWFPFAKSTSLFLSLFSLENACQPFPFPPPAAFPAWCTMLGRLQRWSTATGDASRGPDLVNPKKQAKSGYTNSGKLVVDLCTITERPSFLDYIAGLVGALSLSLSLSLSLPLSPFVVVTLCFHLYMGKLPGGLFDLFVGRRQIPVRIVTMALDAVAEPLCCRSERSRSGSPPWAEPRRGRQLYHTLLRKQQVPALPERRLLAAVSPRR